MNSTRTITLLKCKVVVTNVPDDVDDETLKSYALYKIYLMAREKVIKEMMGFHRAG